MTTEERETVSLIGSDKVQGTAVYGSDGETIGSIERVMIEKISGKVSYAVLSFGGFLGIGDDYYPLPWPSLKYNVELGGYQTLVPVEKIKGAPKYAHSGTWDWESRERARSLGEASALVDRLLSSGKIVVLIMPLLNVGFDVPQRWIENQIRAGQAIKEWKVRADPDLTMQKLRDDFVQILHTHRNNPRLVAVDPLSVICEHDYCYLVRNGQANLRDTAHISNVNAIQFKDLFDDAFKSALSAKTELGN